MLVDFSRRENWTQEKFKEYMDEQNERFDWPSHVNAILKSEVPFELPTIMKNGAVIWAGCSINPNTKIGKGVVIGHGVNIPGPVVIGDKTRIQSFVFIPEGITIEERVFIGPGVIFTNMKYPHVRYNNAIGKVFDKTLIKKGASIGAGSIIGPGITIGEDSLVGFGSVVVKDVKPGWIVRGNPAQHIRKYN